MENFVDPTREQFGTMMKLPDTGVIHMLNMLMFKETATYPDDHPNSEKTFTGAEAYAHYGEESGPIFRRVGGKIFATFEPKLVLIGPDDEVWDAIFIAEYPNASAFGEMVKDPDYQKAVVHRQAAVKNSRLIRMAPRDPGQGFA
ncbi:MAG: DUF1330 domain-containing protein [Pseudomonadota bacterium]